MVVAGFALGKMLIGYNKVDANHNKMLERSGKMDDKVQIMKWPRQEAARHGD